MKKITVSLLLFLFLFFAGTARAATITSTATGGSWTTGATWVGGVVPANTDTAIVATTGGSSVTIGANRTIANVTINSGALVSFSGAFSLSVNGTATVNGTINGATGILKMNFNPSVLGGTGTINNTITIQQPTSVAATANLTTTAIITLANTFTIASGAILNATEIDSSARTVVNNGTVNLSGNYLRTSGTAVWTQGANALLNIKGVFTPAANVTLNATNSGNTVNYNGSSQAIEPASYVNLKISGSGSASVVTGTSVSGTMSIAPTGSATASIGAGLTITVANLTLGGLGRINGTWGSTSSTATNKNNTYFAATTGILSVTNDTRATPTLFVTNSPVIYTGVGQSAAVNGSVPGTASNILTGGAATQTNAGTYAVTANFTPTDTTSYKSLTGASAGNFIINKATPTISVTNSPVVYNGSQRSATITGSVPGAASGVLYNGSATVPTNAGTYAVTANFTPTDTTNYNALTGASAGNFIISKATPTLSVTNSPVTYNAAPQSATVTGSVAGSVSNVKYNGSATVPTNAATYAITADFTPTDTTNYSSLLGASAGNFIINKATPTLSVTNSPVAYDGATHAATVSGSVPGTASSILTGGAATQTAAGTYAVTANFTPTDTTNYNALTGASAGNFVINNTSQTITFGTLSNKTYGEADFSLSASASSGLVVSFASQTPTVCSVSGTIAHLISVGTCTIRASQGGNTNYTAAPNVDQSFTVATKNLTVTGITANDKPYDGNTTATLNVGSAALVGIVVGDTVILNTGSAVGTFASPAVGTGIAVTVSGLTISGASAGNYTVTQPTTTASITNLAPTTTTISPTSATVGAVAFTLTVNGTNFVASSTVQLGGTNRSTTFASSTQLTAQILASDLLTVGTSTIAVFNPAPGGGTSNAQIFTVVAAIDTTAPVITAFTIASTSTSLVVPVTTFTATDNVGVTGYILTEASSTPSLVALGWSTTTPASFAFTTQGSKTLYAWAKDVAGNISTSSSAVTTITLPDTTAPIVTAFGVSATSSSLTIPVTTFTATDNIGVTGYLITEASSTPSVVATGWSVAAPSSYKFATQGNKTLYAWAKDAAGNVSTSSSATTTITFLEIAPGQIQNLFATGVMVPLGVASSTTQVTFNQEVHTVFGGGTTVIIPFNTILSTASSSDFTQLSATNVVSISDLPANYTSVGAVQYGLPAVSLTTSQPATIQIAVGGTYNGQTLTVFKKDAGGTAWSSFTNCSVSGGVCEFSVNGFSSYVVAFYTAPTAPAGASSSGGGVVAPTTVNFSGRAYPGSTVQVFFKSSRDPLYRTVPQATYSVSADGTFDVSYIGLFGGDYAFGLQAEDKDGRKSGIIQTSVDLLSSDKLILRNIFLPPTFSLLRTSVRLGDFISIAGYATTGGTVEVEVDGKTNRSGIIADGRGYYKTLLSTAQLAYGTHTIRVRQKSGGEISDFSSNKVFTVSKVFFPMTDLNNDGRIDISDWSIFLSLWTSKDEIARKRIDFDGDGKVDIADFSIFMQSLKQQ